MLNISTETKEKIFKEIGFLKSFQNSVNSENREEKINREKEIRVNRINKIIDSEADLTEVEKGTLKQVVLEMINYRESFWNHVETVLNKIEIENLKKDLTHWKERAERGEEDAAIHFEALTVTSKKFNEKKLEWWVNVYYKKLVALNTVKNWTIEYNENLQKVKTKDLEEKISISEKSYQDQSKLLQKERGIVKGQEAKIKELQKLLEKERKESSAILEKTRESLKKQEAQNKNLVKENKILQEQLNSHSTTNSLLSKKRKNEELESQHIEKKIKVQNQVTVAQIEVKKY